MVFKAVLLFKTNMLEKGKLSERIRRKATGLSSFLVVFKPGAMHPVTTATIKALAYFWISGLYPEIQATRFAIGR